MPINPLAWGRQLYGYFFSQTAMSWMEAIEKGLPLRQVVSSIQPELINMKWNGKTLLYRAIEKDDEPCVKELIKKGARPEIACDRTGDTCFHAAAEKKHTTLLSLLFEAPIDPKCLNIKNKLEQTALFVACEKGRKDIVKLLIDKSADVSMKCTDEKITALHIAALYGHSDVIEQFRGLNKKIINALDGFKVPALFFASQNGLAPAIKKLLEIGANPMIREPTYKRTVLHIAAGFGRSEVVEVFKGSSPKFINAVDRQGATALFTASRLGRAEVVKKLLEIGADPFCAEPEKKWSALHAAALEGHSKVIECFRGQSAAFINAQSLHGSTALYIASRYGHTEAVKKLLEIGADPSTKCGPNRATALHVAALNGYIDIVKLLITKNPDLLHARIAQGHTPLCAAVEYDKLEIVEYLLEEGAIPLDYRHLVLTDRIRQRLAHFHKLVRLA